MSTQQNARSRVPSKSIGIISTGLPARLFVYNPYPSGILRGVLATADERGYNVTMFTRPWDSRRQSEHWLTDTCIDGVLVLAPSVHTDLIQTLMELGIPAVATSTDSVDINIPTVNTDDKQGATLAVEHLISLGHKRIAHLTGTMTQSDAFVRRDTFFQVMTAHGLTVPGDYVIEAGFDAANAHSTAIRLLQLSNPPTAIFAASDYIAYWAIRAALDRGINVPGDLSVVGYDDSAIAAESRPSITTVRQPLEEIGSVAMNLLLQQVSGHRIEATTHSLPAELIIRESTAQPTE